MKNVTITREQIIASAPVTDDGYKTWINRALPEVIIVSVDDTEVVDAEVEEPAPVEASEAANTDEPAPAA